MLTCYGHRIRLPQNDLAYTAFRLALQETLSDIQLHLDLDEEPDAPTGYLADVPFLQQVSLPVQVDLLAATWARHRSPALGEASLLDAAIVYAACMTAGRITDDIPDVAAAMLRGGPRKVGPKIVRRASYRLEEMFEAFWDDRDFLLIDQWQDLPPDHAGYLKEFLGIPDVALEPMYEALQRWQVSPELAANLTGLLTEAEINEEAMPLLETWLNVRRVGGADPDDEPTILSALEDCYHDLLIGPCEPELSIAEADCPLVFEVGVSEEDEFDCTYAEWVEHFRDSVHKAAEEGFPPGMPTGAAEELPDSSESLDRVQARALENDIRIEPRRDGWVVIDIFDSFLVDPGDAAWVVDEDDPDMPPMIFRTEEAAFHAWEVAQQVAHERAKRREEALRRLGRSG